MASRAVGFFEDSSVNDGGLAGFAGLVARARTRATKILTTPGPGLTDPFLRVGMWRSLVAHLNGVQGAGGSNPLIPTIRKSKG